MENQRSNFSSKIGFILAAAGSAVGLGNIWRFPYLAAKYGGGIFLLVYLILAVTFGFSLMIAEIAIGRKTGVSGIEAFGVLSKKWKFAGLFAAIVPIIILPYYSVIGGWVTKYAVTFITGGMAQTADDAFFGGFISGTSEPIFWFALFLLLTAAVVFFGVEKGIEKASKILMPILIILSVTIAVYSLFMDGAAEGAKYYLIPDFSKFSSGTVLAAMGQLFYSMSLAMGIMITYGSYMPKDTSIEKSVRQIEIFDTGIAFIAGLMIIPPIFAVGTPDMLEKAGPGLMFVSLPKLFSHMAGGQIVGAVFFLMVFFAALTSSISLMETVVSVFMDKFGWKRKTTCLTVAVGSLLVGLPSSLGFGLWKGIKILGMDFLDFFDFSANSVLMPIGAFITCIFVGYVIKPASIIDEVKSYGNSFKAEKLFSVVIKFIAPVCIVLIFLTGMGIIKL